MSMTSFGFNFAYARLPVLPVTKGCWTSLQYSNKAPVILDKFIGIYDGGYSPLYWMQNWSTSINQWLLEKPILKRKKRTVARFENSRLNEGLYPSATSSWSSLYDISVIISLPLSTFSRLLFFCMTSNSDVGCMITISYWWEFSLCDREH